jgi:REP element-mobilizing transposase RayT
MKKKREPVLRLWMHVTLGVKGKQNYLINDLERMVLDELPIVLKDLGCETRTLSCSLDHIHLLVRYLGSHNLIEILEQTKRILKRKINQTFVLTTPFEWIPGFTALSVSLGDLYLVERFIANQKKFHANISYQQEMEYLTSKED